MDKLILFLPISKVSTSNIFVRDIHYKFFHLSDHIIIYKTIILKQAFFNLKTYIEVNSIKNNDILKILSNKIPAETKITLFLLFELEKKVILDWYNLKGDEVYKLLLKNFYVFNVSFLNPYIVSASAVGKILDYKKFVSFDTKLALRYIESIEELSPRNFIQKFSDKQKIKLRKLKNKISL